MSARDVLVLAEIQRGALADVTLELLAAGRQITLATGGRVVVLVPGAGGSALAASLSAADRIVLVDDGAFAVYSPEPYLAVLLEFVKGDSFRAVLIGSTSIGWDLAPLLAARLEAPLVIGCQALRADGESLRVTASFCGGKMQADVEVAGSPAVLMILPGSFRPAGESGEARMETWKPAAPLAADTVRFEELIIPEAGDVDITQQDLLVGIGRGIQQQENVQLAEELAQVLGGVVCASRPVVDQGWLPPTRQVGKSGMTVKPKCYLALGISGAPEHQEGMKGSDLVIAVNTDPKAPIFDLAHYGAELDVLEFLPALAEQVKARKG